MSQENRSNRSLLARRLEQSILTGGRKPGERLREIALAKELGASQGSIREALTELEMRGLVLKQPNRGTYVVELDAADVRDIFRVRILMEPEAAQLLASVLNSETIEKLRGCLTRMREGATGGDYPVFQQAGFDFHRTIWAAQPNRLMEKILNMACLPLFAYDLIRRYAEPYTNYDHVLREYELVFMALLTGQGETAARLLRRFLKQWLREDIRDYARFSLVTPAPVGKLPP